MESVCQKREGVSSSSTPPSIAAGDIPDSTKGGPLPLPLDAATHEAVVSSHDTYTEMERRARLKIDFAVIPLAALIFILCFIDRSNIGNARLAGLEEDLGLTGYDFNSVNSVFFAAYIVFEIPSTVLCKIVGPG